MMKKLLFILFSIVCFIGYSQEYIPINTGYGFETTTTTQLNALTKKVEGDFFYDTTIDSHVYWDGSTFKLFSTKNYIDVQSPRTPFDFAFGTWDELTALTFDNNTVLIPTNDNGDFVTTDGFVDGLTLGLVGSDLTLTATRNGLSDVVSNTVSLPSPGATDHGALTGLADDDHPQYLTQAEGDARYLQLVSYETNTFTPSLVDNGGGATYTASTSTGRYTKVEDEVTFTLLFNAISTSGSPSGELRVTGLPYSGTANQYSFTVSTFFGSSVTFYSISAELIPSTSTLLFKYQDALDGNMASTVSSNTFTGGSIVITGTYIAQ